MGGAGGRAGRAELAFGLGMTAPLRWMAFFDPAILDQLFWIKTWPESGLAARSAGCDPVLTRPRRVRPRLSCPSTTTEDTDDRPGTQ
jgi:hypothetical protein